MDVNIKCIVRYDGTAFSGWQMQPAKRTVQGVLEAALSTIAGQSVRIDAAGRTDAGVHALGQVFSCRWPKALPLPRLRRSLSKMLGPEVRVVSIQPASDEFHATYSALSKRYAYALCASPEPDPFSARYAWCVPWKIDRPRLSCLAQRVVGEHDFAGFRAQGSSSLTTVRTIYSITVRDGGLVGSCDNYDLWHIEYHGSGFLYKMVRNLTGTLVNIARGVTPENRIEELLRSPGPFKGMTAPAHGLFLVEVSYAEVGAAPRQERRQESTRSDR